MGNGTVEGKERCCVKRREGDRPRNRAYQVLTWKKTKINGVCWKKKNEHKRENQETKRVFNQRTGDKVL